MRNRSVVAVVALAVVLGVAPSAAAQRQQEPLVEQVRKAIAGGVQFLREKENNGSWEASDTYSGLYPGGASSIAVLALLNAGVKPTDAVIVRGLKYLRTLDPNNGAWQAKTYVVALQTMAFAEAGYNEDKERIQRNVNWLLAARVIQRGALQGWGYGMREGTADNSNTQYALLGLHAGKQAGVPIGKEVWESIRDFYIRTQTPEGAWIYNHMIRLMGPRLTMTTAGLCGLLIAGMELADSREKLNPDGSAVNCGDYAENRPVAAAVRWVGQNLSLRYDHYTYYNLYGVERAGRLSGQRFLGPHDWYRAGCQFLIAEQSRENGSWAENRISSPVVNTSFALLFLSKGRTPVLMSKLVHGPAEDWNNKHNDVRHVVEYAGRELFHRLPLAWQIFDTRRVEVRSQERRNSLLGDLLQSPVAYFNGHAAPTFSEVEKELLKQYIDQGGFLLAEACCGQEPFDQGFRALMKELFPDNPLKPLSAEHPVWRSHAHIPPDQFKLEGVELGCKTVVIYSPKPLAGWWEKNDFAAGRGQLAFRLAGNVIAYATGMEPPKPRLTQTELVATKSPTGDDSRLAPRGFLKVVQLRHDGDWQPAPRAMRNLMSHLRTNARLDVALQTEPLRPAQPDLIDFRFLYMHGRAAFAYSEADLKNLRENLETGGLLFADACCGRKGFDTAFRTLTTQLFPDKKLEPIPATDDLYGREINGEPITTVRCRTEFPGDFRDIPPALEGIKLNNRWVVIYSKYDIGCALEKHQSTDCLGHDTPSALRLGAAAVLYALKR